MLYLVYDDRGRLRCSTHNWPQAYGALAQLAGACVGAPRMEVYPERGLSVPEASHE